MHQNTPNDAGEWLGHDDRDGAIAMPTDNPQQRQTNSMASLMHRLPLGRANIFGMLLATLVDSWLLATHFVNQLAVPKSVIEVLQALDLFTLHLMISRNLFSRFQCGLTGRTVDSVHRFLGQFVDDSVDLAPPCLIQRNAQGTFDSSLLVEIRRTWPNQNNS
jgi:hypothetical protein